MVKQHIELEVESAIILEALAIELKVLRAKLAISQEQLALRAGVNRTFVGKIETKTSQPSLLVLLRLLKALEVSFPEFAQALMERVTMLDHVKKRKVAAGSGKRRVSS